MVNLTKNNNSLLISSDLQIFPYQESKISVPLNSIYYVLDNSNYVSFKNVNDNTTIFAVSLNELQINGEQATRDNLITLFDSVANGSTSSGGGGGSVSWNDITDKPSTFAPSEHSHTIAQVDGLQEALDGKQASGDYALKSEIPDVSSLATKQEVTEGLASKQDTLVSGTNIKTINGETILGNGNIVISSGGGGTTDYNALSNKPQIAGIELSGNKSLADLGIQAQGDYATTAQLDAKADKTAIADMLTKTEAASTYQPIGDYALKSEIPDVSDLATKAELANYATTASTTNFITKDVNNLTNYETATVAQGKYATKTELNTKLSTDTYNADKATFALKANFWSGTQQEYDAIQTKDPDTFYFITEA